MEVIDVIQKPQFEKHVETCIKELLVIRAKVMDKHPGVQFEGPIEKFLKKKVFNSKAFASLYASMLDKTMNTDEYSSTLRTFIKGVGDEAFRRTIIELKQAEEEQKKVNKQIIGIKKDN